jgi:tRNA(fMet)-specific endonuclease VapC
VSLYVFDTDTLTLFGRLHPVVVRNVMFHLADDIRVTAVSIEEQVGGWYSAIRAARTPQQIADAYARFTDSVRELAGWDTLPFTVSAVQRYQTLLRQKLNVGGNDLRIAATAIEFGATVVTRNMRDFRRIPGVQCEDWSV